MYDRRALHAQALTHECLVACETDCATEVCVSHGHVGEETHTYMHSPHHAKRPSCHVPGVYGCADQAIQTAVGSPR